MGKYQYTKQKALERRWAIHPVWRGIGIIWLILVPVMSYAGAWTLNRALIDSNFMSWGNTFPEMSKPVILPGVMVNRFYFNFNLLISWLPGYPLYYGDVLFFILFLFLGFGITSIVYAFLYRYFGPPRDPFDAVEVRRPVRRRR